MHTTIINDGDENSIGRQASRTASILNTTVTSIKLDKFSEYQGAGTLVDIIDAYEDRDGIILANVAPRHGHGKKWPNGTPFGFFKYKNVRVYSTIDGYTLSLCKKFDLIDKLIYFEIAEVVEFIKKQGLFASDYLVDHIIKTQYRSYEFQPRLVEWDLEGLNIPHHEYDIKNIAELNNSIWWIDNYGNCKTSILPSELNVKVGDLVETRFGKIKFYERMKDVPDGESAILIGSSGIEDKRFIEFIIQGQSAAEKYGLKVGDSLLV